MAGTNAYAAKRALITALQGAAGLGADGVQVAYSWPGERAERECIYGGAVVWDTKVLTMAAGGRLSRREDMTLDLHIAVTVLGAEPEEAEARAVDLGTVLEEYVAFTTTLNGLPGVKLGQIAGGELDHAENDDSVIAVLSYRVTFLSTLDMD
jgi:hypothetical protein